MSRAVVVCCKLQNLMVAVTITVHWDTVVLVSAYWVTLLEKRLCVDLVKVRDPYSGRCCRIDFAAVRFEINPH
jgi:hypothetical protein